MNNKMLLNKAHNSLEKGIFGHPPVETWKDPLWSLHSKDSGERP